MAAVGDDGGDGGGVKSTFRWLNVVRYAVATVVTALIVAVIAEAVKVVLRPDSLYLFVVQGSVISTRPATPATDGPKLVSLDINLRGQNPSGRVRMCYTNITAYLFDKNTSAWTTNPIIDSMIFFHPKDIVLLQEQASDFNLHTPANDENMTPSYLDILYEGRSISDVTMRLDGYLITEATVNRSRQTTYYCWPLLIGRATGAGGELPDDVLCKEMQRGQFIQ